MVPIIAFCALVWPGKCFGDGYTDAKVERLLVSKTAYNGQPLNYLKTDRPEVTVLLVTIPPGGSTGWHEHPVPVYAYMLEGELTVELKNGGHYRFVKGDPVLEVVNQPHNGRNTGTTDARLLVFYTGATDLKNVIRSQEEQATP